MRKSSSSGYLGAQYGDPEDEMDFNYSSDKDYSSNIDQGTAKPDSSSVASSAASGAAMGGPAGAAISVGGQFLANYLANRAAEERQKRDMAMKAQSEYGQNQNSAIGNMMSAYSRALR